MSSPGGAVGIDLFQQDGFTSPRLPPGGQHFQHCPIIGAEEQDCGVTIETSRAIHSYLGQESPGEITSGQGNLTSGSLVFQGQPMYPGPFPQLRVFFLALSLPFHFHGYFLPPL